MTVLEPSNPTRIAGQLRERFARASAAADETLTFARTVELSQLFSRLRVLGEVLDATWLLRATDAALAVIEELPFPEAPSAEARVALARAVQELGEAVHTVADGGSLDDHESSLRMLTAMLGEIDEESSLTDFDVFVGSAVRELEVTRQALARLAVDPTERAAVNEAFRAIHTVRGDSGVMGASQVELVCRRLEAIFEELRSGQAVATETIVAACQTLVEHAVVAVLQPGQLVDVDALDQLGACIDDGRSLAKATRLGELLVNQQMVDEHDLDLALAIKSGPVGQTLVNLRAIGTDDLDQVLALQKELRRQGSSHPRTSTAHVRRVSVAEVTLQELMRAVKELQTRVVDLPTIPLMQEVVQLTERLQMQTVGALFRKLARAARALAEELEKDVWVSVAGADIEVHRELVDAMDGPLLQLVRNALDHGIERPLVRQVAGKPARATLNLHAHLMGTQLVIEVGDDGAGIDSERVLQRAIDMGLVAPGDVTSLSDDEVQALIFEPGLSATDRVGRISGRGVGMDVVETAVENAGGRITVASQRGLGTRFRIVVPQRR